MDGAPRGWHAYTSDKEGRKGVQRVDVARQLHQAKAALNFVMAVGPVPVQQPVRTQRKKGAWKRALDTLLHQPQAFDDLTAVVRLQPRPQRGVRGRPTVLFPRPEDMMHKTHLVSLEFSRL